MWSDIKCDALRDLVPFLQFKKREKHPWRSVNTLLPFVQMVPNRAAHHKYLGRTSVAQFANHYKESE